MLDLGPLVKSRKNFKHQKMRNTGRKNFVQ